MTERNPPVNPYVVGNPLTTTEMFFGREDVFEFVRQTLTGQHQDNIIVLYGQRRTGKTSALYQIRQHIDPKYIPILIDLQALSMNGLATFLWEIALATTRALGRNYNINVERPKQEDFVSSPRERFQDVFLNQVWAAIGDRHLLLMFDEAVRLEDQVLAGTLERDVFDYMRHLMQHNDRLNFIFALGSRLEEMQQEYSVLFNVALYKEISFLAPQDARSLIVEPVKAAYRYDDEAIQEIIEIGGRHPYYTQLICHSLFSRCAGAQPVVTIADVQAVLPEVVERCTANLKFVWDQASPVEKFALSTMADLVEERNRSVAEKQIERTLRRRQIVLSASEINSALGNLVRNESIVEAKGYAFAVDLLRLYIRDTHRLEWILEEVSKEMEEARRTGNMVPQVTKRRLTPKLLIGTAAAIALATLGLLLAPASPVSLLAPAPTPAPTPTIAPVPPKAGLYEFQRCGLPSLGEEMIARLKLCVESVEVASDGTMKYYISWEAQIPQGLTLAGEPVVALGKESDVGNTHMYITDDRGNRYDFFELGGAARDKTSIPNGQKAIGWYLFPPPKEGGRRFTFHDDDNFWAIAGIVLEE